MGLRVWSGGEIFSKKINKKSWAHKAPPLIITTVKSIWVDGGGSIGPCLCFDLHIGHFFGIILNWKVIVKTKAVTSRDICFNKAV